MKTYKNATYRKINYSSCAASEGDFNLFHGIFAL